MVVDDLFGIGERGETVIEYYQWNDQYRKEIMASSLGEAKAALVVQLGVMRRHYYSTCTVYNCTEFEMSPVSTTSPVSPPPPPPLPRASKQPMMAVR